MVNKSLHNFVTYLNETIGISLEVCELENIRSIPFAIRNHYEVSMGRVMGRDVVLLLERKKGSATPSALAKQLQWIEEKLGLKGILLAKGIAPYQRSRFIKNKIPFVVPHEQAFLPLFGMDLREKGVKLKEVKEAVSPATQLIILAWLNRKPVVERWTVEGICNSMGYSRMTVGRAIKQLEGLGLIEEQNIKRGRVVQELRMPVDRKLLWMAAKQHLRSPVKKRIFLERSLSNIGLASGISALSKITMISGESREVVAILDREWTKHHESQKTEVVASAHIDLCQTEIELWSYDPRILADGKNG
jgi:DNA-binding MarR family transcriptional regulator